MLMNNVLWDVTVQKRWIADFHDSVIWLKLPEIISFFFIIWILKSQLGLNNNYPN